MLTPSLNTVMTRLLIVAAVLATLIIFVLPSTFAKADETVMYAENGTDAVRTFTSTDPEGAGIDWDVTGLDADFFMIDARGVLMFKSPPNYESAKDKARNLNADTEGASPDFLDYRDAAGTIVEGVDGTAIPAGIPARDREFMGGDNDYQVTVRATEQMTPGADVRALSTETDVTVTVTDVDEDGTASMNRLQPEVATAIRATLRDVDTRDGALDFTGTLTFGTKTYTLGWEWYVSKVTEPLPNVDDHWILATGIEATETDASWSSYTPAGKRVANADAISGITGDVAVDEGKYLRAVVTYLDMGHASDGTTPATTPVEGDIRTAIAVSVNPVRAEVSSDNDGTGVVNPENGSPGFSSTGDYKRSIDENSPKGTPLGAPVVATDPNGDTLTYELDSDSAGPDGIPGNTDDVAIASPNTTDVSQFKVDVSSGQITVNVGNLDHEGRPGGEYKFYIRAIDPSGESDEQLITVTADDVNDAPTIMGSLDEADIALNNNDIDTDNVDVPAAPSELVVNEQDSDDEDDDGKPDYTGMPDMPLPGQTGAGLGANNVFTADDKDARGQIFWTLEGEDADDFVLTSTGLRLPTGLGGPDEPIAIRFASAPDYENPTDSNLDSVYKVTLVATDSPGARSARPLTIFVVNQYEQGKVVLDEDQPLIGQPISASVDDPDNNVAVVTWKWERATSTAPDATWTVIKGATASTYVPRQDDKSTTVKEQDDNGYYLRVTATYTDVTSDLDMMGPGSVYRDERTMKGTEEAPLAKESATSTDGMVTDKLYRVMAVSANAVRIAPTDPSGVDAPEFASDSFDRTVAENAEVRTIVGAPVQVVPELDDKGKPKTTFSYDIGASITGHEEYFTIDADSGQIRVGEVDFPNPVSSGVDLNCQRAVADDLIADCPEKDDPVLDYEGNNTFSLIVTATDNQNGSRKTTARVDITLENLNESPYFDKESRDRTAATTTYAEMRTNPVVQIAAVEPDGMGLRWELTGADASDFAIEDVQDVNDGKDRRQLVFSIDPDYESGKGSKTSSEAAADTTAPTTNDAYYVTVRATEMSAVGGGPNMDAELDIIVRVTNSTEGGKVAFNWLQPEVGTAITASISDPDGVLGTPAPTYTWYRSKVSNPNRSPGSTDAALAGEWELIESEWEGLTGNACAPDPVSTTAPSDDTYTPQGDCAETDANERTTLGDEVDEGDYLLVRAVYADGSGDGTAHNATSTGITAYAVRNDVSHDANNSPDFAANKATREIAEDAAIGDPVGAPVVVVHNEDDDILTYEIVAMCASDTTSIATDHPCAAPLPTGATYNAGDGNNSVVPGDVAFFDIDRATGQIMVKKKLSYEIQNGNGGFEADGSYTVVVRATDPSGETTGNENRDDIVVTINVSDVNEAPRITEGDAELAIYEVNSTDKDTVFDKYVGLGYMTDDDDDPTNPNLAATPDDRLALDPANPNLYKRTEEDLVDRAIWPEPIAGPDGALFEYSIPADGIGRRLHFKIANRPDFENPMDANRDNVYEVTVTVRDEDGAMGTKNVRVTVMNVNEAGTLTLSPEQPDDGMPVIATIEDPDGVVSITNWSWATATSTRVVSLPPSPTADTARDANNDGEFDLDALWTVIPEATASEYEAESGRFVWAMVEYRDGHNVENDPVTALDERNDDPDTTTTADEDTEQHKYPLHISTDASGEEVISSAERTADLLFHNSDKTKSKVTDNAVQPDPDDPDAPSGPSTGVEMITRMVYENVPSTGYVGAPLEGLGYKIPGAGDNTVYRDTISGPDVGSFVFAEDYDHTDDGDEATFATTGFFVYYDASLQGPPTTAGPPPAGTEIEGDKRGQLALKPVIHLDYETKDTYVIEVSDPDATISVSTYRITINVLDVNERPTTPKELKGPPPVLNTAPMFAATSTTFSVDENAATGTAVGMVMATDADRGDQETLVYSLDDGADAASFAIDSATGGITTAAVLDYEMKDSYMVTVTATDDDGATATTSVTIMVNDLGLDNAYDVNEDGVIDISEATRAVQDFFAGRASAAAAIAAIQLYFAGTGS